MSMVNSTRSQEMREIYHHHHPSPPLPSSKAGNCGGGGNSFNLNGGCGGLVQNTAAGASNGGTPMEITAAAPLTPKFNSRSEPNPYPTTFVQADTSNFKQVVQMLTGSSETVTKQQQLKQHQQQPPHPSDPPASPGPQGHQSSKSTIPPIWATPKRSQQQQGGFGLYERRNPSHLKNSLIINTLIPGLAVSGGGGGFSSRNNGNSSKQPENLSPSMLELPKLTLSPVTPLVNPFNGSSSPSLGGSSSSSSSEEERAIAQKGFYLHPSPMNTPRGAEPPQLLPLFPVNSPRISGASS
ncbi:hypothetical protein SAY86_012367 [Trapa natans]|uniref:VQ domain-containing protein n=1 Tax=Trapa natans TaxID=22666 RepID=A0AAN7RD16_TRANT|nr:hypothetical protein SAY86_012367 [Trapa natans]